MCGPAHAAWPLSAREARGSDKPSTWGCRGANGKAASIRRYRFSARAKPLHLIADVTRTALQSRAVASYQIMPLASPRQRASVGSF